MCLQVPPADIEQPPLRPCGLTPKSTKSGWAEAVRPIESVPLSSTVTTATTAATAAAAGSGQKVTFQINNAVAHVPSNLLQQQQQIQQGGAMHAIRPSWGATTAVAITKQVGLQSGGTSRNLAVSVIICI
jgi:hypothetical protein